MRQGEVYCYFTWKLILPINFIILVVFIILTDATIDIANVFKN